MVKLNEPQKMEKRAFVYMFVLIIKFINLKCLKFVVKLDI